MRTVTDGGVAGFAIESRSSIGVIRECFRQYLDCDLASQFRVSGLIHLAHSTCSQVAGDLVMREPGSDHWINLRWILQYERRLISSYPISGPRLPLQRDWRCQRGDGYTVFFGTCSEPLDLAYEDSKRT
jgi:hypothetical protein